MAKVTIGPSTHLFPKPAVLIAAMVEGKANFMTVSWCGIASQSPPHISVAIHNIRHTLKGIEEHGAFSVNLYRPGCQGGLLRHPLGQRGGQKPGL